MSKRGEALSINPLDGVKSSKPGLLSPGEPA